MVSVSETNGMTSIVDVCVDPDVDAIDLPLTVTLTATDRKAGEFPAHMHVMLSSNIYSFY